MIAMQQLFLYFDVMCYCASAGDVSSRGPAEEPGPVHRLPAHQRAALLSGSGPAAAQSYVGRHAQLLGRVSEHPPTDSEPQPGATSVAGLPAQPRLPRSPLRWVRHGPRSSAATGAPDPFMPYISLVFSVSIPPAQLQQQSPPGAARLRLLSLPDGCHELECLQQLLLNVALKCVQLFVSTCCLFSLVLFCIASIHFYAFSLLSVALKCQRLLEMVVPSASMNVTCVRKWF